MLASIVAAAPPAALQIAVRHARLPALLASILIIFLGSGCGAAASAQEGSLVVFAAASLKDALDEVNAAYRRNLGNGDYHLLCRELDLGKADRGRSTRRYFHLRGSRLDGLSGKEEFDQSRDTSQPAR